MKFSVFQISRKGGREKNEDRMGYCYTRESGLFVLADGMGGHPEGEVAAQLALQTISALYQTEARPHGARTSAEFLSGALMAAHHQIIRYASEKGMLDTPRTTLVAAVLQGTHRHLGALRRLAPVRRARRRAAHAHARPLVPGAAERRRDAHASSINRNILFTCLGSPTKPVFDMTGPGACCSRATRSCCAPTACGAALDDDEIVRAPQRPAGVRGGARPGGDGAAQRRRPPATT